ncbi:MAG: BON domain-containing protein [Rubrivivax sp.]
MNQAKNAPERAARTRTSSAARALCGLLGAVCVGAALSGCVALAGGALVGGSMLAVDRRSTGVQVDDQGIEVKAGSAIGAAIADRGHVNITAYNRTVLLTGEVPVEADRLAAEAAAGRIAGVRGVVNDLVVMPNASLSAISNDSIITAKVKAAFLDSSQLQVSSIKVVTERGVVYLMGRVTEAESTRAAEVTRGVGGVRKVVKVFEIITPAELATMPAPPQSPAPAASGARK